MDSREIIKILKEDGWQLKRTKGSHHQYNHPVKKGLVTVQHPVKDLRKDVLNSIKNQAGLK